MTDSLNEMLLANKGVISSIADNSHTVGSNCDVLQVAVEEIWKKALKRSITQLQQSVLL